jgi:FixJ family two-component response regulator
LDAASRDRGKPEKPPRARIGIVGEDDAVVNAVGFALSTEGYDIRAVTGDAALLAERDFAGLDCLVVQRRAPGLDEAALRRLCARAGRIPKLMITFHPDAALRRTLDDLGVGLVEMPLMGSELSDCIRGLTA